MIDLTWKLNKDKALKNFQQQVSRYDRTDMGISGVDDSDEDDSTVISRPNLPLIKGYEKALGFLHRSINGEDITPKGHSSLFSHCYGPCCNLSMIKSSIGSMDPPLLVLFVSSRVRVSPTTTLGCSPQLLKLPVLLFPLREDVLLSLLENLQLKMKVATLAPLQLRLDLVRLGGQT